MDRSLTLWRRAGAEGIAAFALVFAGCGAIISDVRYDAALGTVGIALVFGLVIMVMVYATGHLSGAHINPAVTLAFTITRHFPLRDALAYIAAQLLGACAAAACLLAIWTDTPASLGATVPTVGVGSALVYEGLLTALLMFVIMAVATDTRAVGAAAAIAIGGTIGLDALFGGPVTGASMNPARSFGPALMSGEWSDFWVYVIGPIGGAALGAFAYQLVRGPQRDLAVPDGQELGPDGQHRAVPLPAAQSDPSVWASDASPRSAVRRSERHIGPPLLRNATRGFSVPAGAVENCASNHLAIKARARCQKAQLSGAQERRF